MVMNLIVAATVVQVAGALLASAATAAGPQTARLDPDQAMARSEQAIGRSIGAHTLTDTTGAPLSLASYRGKPLIISLVYSSCSSICPPTTQHLLTVIGEARRVLGADRFEVLTVGFDARHDTPARMSQFAAKQGIKLSNWRVASADAGTLAALLRELGFSYAAAAGGFDHIAQTTVIDGNGRVYRQVYGDDFPLPMLLEPLKYLIFGGTTSLSINALIDRLRFICTTYDPAAARYRIDYGLAFGSVIAAMTLLAFGGLLLREWQRARQA
jgi:protein SCO1/2